MSTSSRDDLGKLILRLVLGIFLLTHGLTKISNGVGTTVSTYSQNFGIPEFLMYGVFIGEVLAPILIIIGLFARLGGLLGVINMLFAFGFVHFAQIGTFKGFVWQWELQGFFLFTSVVVTLIGAGRHSLGGAGGKWN
jgi:putative oxidoreductase